MQFSREKNFQATRHCLDKKNNVRKTVHLLSLIPDRKYADYGIILKGTGFRTEKGSGAFFNILRGVKAWKQGVPGVMSMMS